VTNVGYQVDLSDSRAGFGINSHPGSELTIRDNAAPLTIGLWIDGSAAFEPLTGLEAGTGTPITRSLTHQGRTLRLENVVLNPYAWQIYVAPPPSASREPMRIERSTINELGVFSDTPVVARDVHVQWAIIGATSSHADVTFQRSEIDVQAVMAENDSTVRIEDSAVYGSMLQARGRSTIAVINSALQGNRSNPAMARQAAPTLNPVDQARIVVLGLRPLAHSHRPGEATPLAGDAYVRTADGTSTPEYTLSYRRNGGGTAETIPATRAGGAGRLGALPATLREPGSYEVTLELTIDGTTYRASRPFTVAADGAQR
jgi:hypothetical protein